MQKISIDSLPNELVAHVASFLSIQERNGVFNRVCKLYKQIIVANFLENDLKTIEAKKVKIEVVKETNPPKKHSEFRFLDDFLIG